METFSASPPSAAQLRALLAFHAIPLYIIGARIRIHPIRLGRMLGGRVSLPPALADRVQRAIEQEAAAK